MWSGFERAGERLGAGGVPELRGEGADSQAEARAGSVGGWVHPVLLPVWAAVEGQCGESSAVGAVSGLRHGGAGSEPGCGRSGQSAAGPSGDSHDGAKPGGPGVSGALESRPPGASGQCRVDAQHQPPERTGSHARTPCPGGGWAPRLPPLRPPGPPECRDLPGLWVGRAPAVDQRGCLPFEARLVLVWGVGAARPSIPSVMVTTPESCESLSRQSGFGASGGREPPVWEEKEKAQDGFQGGGF